MLRLQINEEVSNATLLGLHLQSCDRCVCHRVGDMIKFGLSTRLYLFNGPEELRPEEGLSKLQKKQLAVLEVCNPHCLSLLYGILNWGEAYLIPYLANARAKAGTDEKQSINHCPCPCRGENL